MTSIFKTPHGEMQQFLQNLHTGGFTYEDIQRINRDPIHTQRMHMTLNKGVLLTSNVLTKQFYAPSWYVSALEQFERVMQLNEERSWGFSESDLRTVSQFKASSRTEVPLLCVYLPDKGEMAGLHRTFDELWGLIKAPRGYTKYCSDELTVESLRQTPGCDYVPGIRWVGFDPNSYRGQSPEAALGRLKVDGVQLAGVESLMATLLFPEWAASWDGATSPCPWLAGLQFDGASDWPRSMFLGRWDVDRRMGIRTGYFDTDHFSCSSPSVRTL